MVKEKLLADIILIRPIEIENIKDEEYMKTVPNSSKIEKIYFDDMGIKFHMSQLTQLIRSRMRVNDEVPDSSVILYLKGNYAYMVELIYNKELLANILYYEIRINDMFDILDEAGYEIKNVIEENQE